MSETETTEATDGASIEQTIPSVIEQAEEKTVTQESTAEKPSGYDPIDPATASPEQTKDRLDYLYGQVKHSDREKREMRRILADQSRVINELTSGMNNVVTHLQDKSLTDSETQIKQLMDDAWNRGDNKAYQEAQAKLIKLEVQKNTRPQPKQQYQSPQNQFNSTAEIAQAAVDSGELTTEEYRATESWQNEKDENGRQLRPWAISTDPSYKQALYEAQAVWNNPRFANVPYEQKLLEIDKRMGVIKRTNSQNVMGGGLTSGKKSTKLTLTPKQQEIAIKTKYAGPKATEAEHLDKYRKQIEKYQQKGAR